MHLLLQLSNNQDGSQLQGSVIESVFASKINNQTTYRDKSNENMRMVEVPKE
jgi:hypothetical protein